MMQPRSIGMNVSASAPVKVQRGDRSSHLPSDPTAWSTRLWPRTRAIEVKEGLPFPARRALGRRGHQLRAVLRQRHQGRGVPLRCLRQRTETANASTLPEYTDQIFHGYLDGRASGHVLRLPRARALSAGGRPSLQPQQDAARPLRPRARLRARVEPGLVRLQDGSDGRRHDLRRARFGAVHAQMRGRRPELRLAAASPPGFRVPWDDTITYETHVKRLHQARPEGARGAARHLRRARAEGGGRLHQGARRHLGGAAADPHVSSRTISSSTEGAGELLGLQHDRLLRADAALRRRRARTRCASSRRWSPASTRPGSRSFSTWSTTTPPRATSSARRCRSRASTTPRTTGCCRNEKRYYINDTGTGNTVNLSHPRVIQMVTDSACATGSRRCMSTASASTSAPSWRASRTVSTTSRAS